MNKICTSIEQAKKLAEILPIESADMEYMFLKRDGSKVSNVPFVKDGFEEPECCYIFIPCWSLAALINVLPNENMLVKTTDGEYYCLAKDIMTKHYDNPIDACVKLILKLHELNLL